MSVSAANVDSDDPVAVGLLKWAMKSAKASWKSMAPYRCAKSSNETVRSVGCSAIFKRCAPGRGALIGFALDELVVLACCRHLRYP